MGGIDVLKQITDQLVGVAQQIKSVSEQFIILKERQSKQGIRLWIVIAGFILDVILTVALAIVVLNLSSQSDQLKTIQSKLTVTQNQLHTDQINACMQGNLFRVKQRQFWNIIITFENANPRPNLTPAQKAARAASLREFIAALNNAYAPLDCSALYKLQ